MVIRKRQWPLLHCGFVLGAVVSSHQTGIPLYRLGAV